MAGVSKETIIQSMQQALGIEKSEDLVADALQKAGLSGKGLLSDEDVKKLSDNLIQRGGLVSIVARNVFARLVISGAIRG